MNLILLKEQDFISYNRAILEDYRLVHIRKVLQARQGDCLAFGLLNGKMGQGRIVSLTDSQALIETKLTIEPPLPSGISLVLALPRPKMLKRIVQTVTILGVKQIHIINSWRVEKSFWDSPFMVSGGLLPYMIAGLEQAKDTVLPDIFQHRFFSSFVQETLPKICEGKKGIVAHPKASESYPSQLQNIGVLAIGPEGGFVDQEINSFEEQGMVCVSFGQRILRVETAVPYLIAKLDGIF